MRSVLDYSTKKKLEDKLFSDLLDLILIVAMNDSQAKRGDTLLFWLKEKRNHPLTWFYIPSLSCCTWSRPLPSTIITAVPFSLPLSFYISTWLVLYYSQKYSCVFCEATWEHWTLHYLMKVCVSHLMRSDISYATASSWLQNCGGGALCWSPLRMALVPGWRVGLQWILLTTPSFPVSPLPLLSCCILQLCIQLIASVHHKTILKNVTLLKHKTADNNVGVIPWGYKLLLNSLIHKLLWGCISCLIMMLIFVC